MALIDKINKISQASKKYSITRQVKLGEVRLILAPLTTDEDIFLRSFIKEAKNSGANPGIQYQVGIVALAIKKLDNEEIGDIPPDGFIETGELTKNGVPEKKERFTLMRDLVLSIDPYIISELFDVVSELILEAENKVKADMVTAHIPEPPDKPAVIERGELSGKREEVDSQGTFIVENKDSEDTA